jgi:hypothetical protein
MGSFRLTAGTSHLHEEFKFTEITVETVEKSLRHSTGRNLPDKRFCYLRTVRVTAAVYWGLSSKRILIRFTFEHRAGVRPYTSCSHLAESCVFSKQSPLLILCYLFSKALLIPKLQSKFAEFLHHDSLVRLSVLHQSTGHSLSTVFFGSFSWKSFVKKKSAFPFYYNYVQIQKRVIFNILTIKKSIRFFLRGRLTHRVRPIKIT